MLYRSYFDLIKEFYVKTSLRSNVKVDNRHDKIVYNSKLIQIYLWLLLVLFINNKFY